MTTHSIDARREEERRKWRWPEIVAAAWFGLLITLVVAAFPYFTATWNTGDVVYRDYEVDLKAVTRELGFLPVLQEPATPAPPPMIDPPQEPPS